MAENTEGKRIVVLGAGESGTGAAYLAKKKGMEVFVSDKGRIKEENINVLSQAEIAFEEGKHSEIKVLSADEVIKSPGIPDHSEIIQKVISKGIPIISEIEFASRYTNAHKTCITGSNGKTTTTLLTWHILKNAGLHVGLAGNIGKSFARQVADHDYDHYVLEISSYQLDGMYDFRADTAILLNITPDHLDRYDYKFENYAGSKFRILRNQRASDAFIYCYDDEATMNFIGDFPSKAKQYPFSIKEKISGNGAWIENENIIINTDQNHLIMTLETLALQGKHNIYNSMAAGIAARVLDLKKETVKESLSDFQNIEHRLEFVANIHGVEYINDSKATNVNATWYALESMKKPVIWIVGGVDKGNDYQMLAELIEEKVKGIICLGTDNRKILESLHPLGKEMQEAFSMDEAIELAYEMSHQGDVVLLSPACASFDLFVNYEERGRLFKECVTKL